MASNFGRGGVTPRLRPAVECFLYIDSVLPLPERQLVARIRQRAQTSRHRSGLPRGIGDDCAVLRIPHGHEALITTDFSLEGIHFRRDWHPPEVVGHRCLTRGLSDIAAMGAEPRAAFLSLALPPKLPQSWVTRFLDGFLKLAGQFKVPLAGGDTAQSPDGILADVIVLGSVPRGEAILRSGAQPGDRVYVSGALGGSAAAIEKLMRRPTSKISPDDFPQHFHPIPRIQVGRFLRVKGLASAMIDVSDGLSTDLAHLCEESRVGAVISAEAIPRDAVGRENHKVDLRFALHGGDDYELLFAVPKNRRVPARIAGVPITLIGHLTRRKNMVLMGQDGSGVALKPQGWEHFRG
jgi:thiamine-monophosphate kinase